MYQRGASAATRTAVRGPRMRERENRDRLRSADCNLRPSALYWIHDPMASAIRASLTSLARRWSALSAARAEAAAAREFWDAGAPGEPEDRYWGSQPLVRRAINR